MIASGSPWPSRSRAETNVFHQFVSYCDSIWTPLAVLPTTQFKPARSPRLRLTPIGALVAPTPRPRLGRIVEENSDDRQNLRTVSVDVPQFESIIVWAIRIGTPSSRNHSRERSIFVASSRPAYKAASNDAPGLARASVFFADCAS